MTQAANTSRTSWLTRLGIVALVVLAYYLGTQRPAVAFHEGVAHSAEGAITLEAAGWSYGVGLDGVRWIDQSGTWHESGRPGCLPPGGTTELVRFGAVEVTIDGSTWRPVVLVDCR